MDPTALNKIYTQKCYNHFLFSVSGIGGAKGKKKTAAKTTTTTEPPYKKYQGTGKNTGTTYYGGQANQWHVHYYGKNDKEEKGRVSMGTETYEFGPQKTAEQNWLEAQNALHHPNMRDQKNCVELRNAIIKLRNRYRKPVGEEEFNGPC